MTVRKGDRGMRLTHDNILPENTWYVGSIDHNGFLHRVLYRMETWHLEFNCRSVFNS